MLAGMVKFRDAEADESATLGANGWLNVRRFLRSHQP
jgi:hypothetical protein